MESSGQGAGGLLSASNPALTSLLNKAKQKNDSDSEAEGEDWD